VLAFTALVVLTFAAARSCQQRQVRISKEQAIVTARREVAFDPRRTQVRMVRQGLQSRPVWAVSLSIPGRQPDTFSRIAVVRVDANTGKVLGMATQR
jgi:hypothetical protein